MSSAESSLAIAVDIGGTFTDISLLDRSSGKVWRAKTPSVPQDPSEAFLTGIRLALADAGAEASELARVLHGTTVATNMILEGKGARTALVTTRGFRHVLAIGRQDIPRKANLYNWVKPERPVPASRIVEVDERLAAGGAVLETLDEDSVRQAASAIRAMNVEAVGVCLMHAFANPAHERRVAEILREQLPDIAVTISTDVLPVVREYERSLTTALNAAVMPGVTSYVGRLERRLEDEKVAAPLLLMKSNGGVAGAAAIREAPALTALSGPAAGVVGARAIAAACGIRDLITVDIGGTSADICLIKDGRIDLTQHGKVGDWPLPLPMVDMVTIGAGGGSIAAVEDATLTVGPRSAGARPGPAAYGHGGQDATVTDAHVVLGHLPEKLLGGRMGLDVEAAREVVRKGVAEPLGLSLEAAARGVLQIVDNHMVGAVRVVSVERGHDPRHFTLVPFGGAGPLHGCALAELLGISRVMIPPAPGVLCADGLLAADLKAEFSRTLPKAGAIDVVTAKGIFGELEQQADAWLTVEGVPEDKRQTDRVALLRYYGQGGEIAIPWAETREAVEEAFTAEHKALYGFALDAPIELVTLRVEATGLTSEPPRDGLQPGGPLEAYDHAPVQFADGTRDVPLIDRNTIGAGTRFDGPVILTQLDTTILVPPGWTGEAHAVGAIILTRQEGTAA
ncbi:hydantoinase/oxoprolinase family protein [Nitratireductor aquimarinus]|uniref:hydantoinase/oxoprolinase family protein n=1 Tax=Nitratireductor TaxID=245876 RepID=UPI0019D3CA31|nr:MULTISPECIES: hydantoinase/oxoprolinase family protein [Nitratireductor]MBN7776279.1 hydantoinase/oxoprolinase family protein [Nitratireductor pacificus]MBN7779146.1 hydantoinase/oxoprolinase family protein [Nitratireductor pacificus]MBN7787953.1 hydantoinase/oxoprolinase family protein [Nitratireductor aquimarinus]MBY6098000.1 hydantoinase/oxoprolinase family protein [Nitratireductor aquimarinus]